MSAHKATYSHINPKMIIINGVEPLDFEMPLEFLPTSQSRYISKNKQEMYAVNKSQEALRFLSAANIHTHRLTGWLESVKCEKANVFVVVASCATEIFHREIVPTLSQFIQVNSGGRERVVWCVKRARASNHVATSFTASNDRHGSTNNIIFHKLVEAHALELSGCMSSSSSSL